MTDVTILTRGEAGRLKTGQWGLWRGHVLVACPHCGVVNRLDSHEIDHDGKVTPSIVCPEDGCDWHVWGRLDGWETPA